MKFIQLAKDNRILVGKNKFLEETIKYKNIENRALSEKIERLEEEVQRLKAEKEAALCALRDRELADGEAWLGRLLNPPFQRIPQNNSCATYRNVQPGGHDGPTEVAGPSCVVNQDQVHSASRPLLSNHPGDSETGSSLTDPTAAILPQVISRTPSTPLLIISNNVGDVQDVDDDQRQPSSPSPPPLTRQNKRRSRLASSQSHHVSSSKMSSRRRSSRNIRTSITKGRNPSSLSSGFEYQSPVSNSQSLAKHCPSRKNKVQRPKKAKTVIRCITSTQTSSAVATTPPVHRNLSALNGGTQVLRAPAPVEHPNPSMHLCDICGQQFTRLDNMHKHRRNVHQINRDGHPIELTAEWKCTECYPNVEFSAKNYLQEHAFKFHANPGAANRCRFCQKPFRTGTGCRQHEKRCRKKPENTT